MAGSGRAPCISLFDGNRSALFFGMHFRGFAVDIFQEVMKKYDYLLPTPDLVAQKLGRGLQACAMPLGRVSQVKTGIT